MACRMVLRSVFLMEPCLSFRPDRELPVKHYRTVRGRDFHLAARRAHRLSCSYKEGPSTSYGDDHDQGPPQEAVLKAISEVSKTEGRVGQTTNVVIGGTVADDSTNEWLALDQKVNSYPTVRGFTAIGTGGEDFVQAMVVAVESVIQQPIPEGRVRQKVSSRGKYVSVNIGPVQVVSSEQSQANYMSSLQAVMVSSLFIIFLLVELRFCN
ncbi:uncharacterized protein LOC120007476 isoform X2 [Tripterygium wilfordii]|uniref:uncharacterized protein LOC120007476 isoform X2 n=1 Tax=Tripterygium wilfordii TaxID=458696 RepID=UPI0018F7EC0B|nr:uncharacterized protein LOC120007476 isoform X2 [Tripterygium wilfordii]